MEMKREVRITKGEFEQLWCHRESKYIKVKVVSISETHVTVEMGDKKLWTLSRNDYLSMRESGRMARERA